MIPWHVALTNPASPMKNGQRALPAPTRTSWVTGFPRASLITQDPHRQTPHSAVVLIDALDGNGLMASKKFCLLGIPGIMEPDGVMSARMSVTSENHPKELSV